MEKYGRAGQATDDDITRRMCFACLMPKATNTHSEYVIHTACLLLSHCNSGCKYAPQYYVTVHLPV